MVVPAIVPWRRVESEAYVRCAPRAKHRGDILRLYPHLISRHHNVVVCGVESRNVVYRAAANQVVVARGHLVCRRLEAIETACIGALVVVCHDVCVRWFVVYRSIVLSLGSSGICLRGTCLPLCLAHLSLETLSLGLGLELRCNLCTVVCPIEVVCAICRRVEHRRASRECECHRHNRQYYK